MGWEYSGRLKFLFRAASCIFMVKVWIASLKKNHEIQFTFGFERFPIISTLISQNNIDT